MKTAIIVAGVVAGTFSFDSNACSVSTMDGVQVEIPDDSPVDTGWTYFDGEFAPPARAISANDVRSKLTLAERVKWDAGKLDEIATVKLEFSNPRSVADAEELLNFLSDSGVISKASVGKVLA